MRALIGQAYAFSRKHPALRQAALWLVLLPSILINVLLRIVAEPTLQPYGFSTAFAPETINVLLFLLNILIALITFWGTTCILVIGKRLAGGKAGRSKTSFKATRQAGAKVFVPFLLTAVLRACQVFLWSLLLIVPGILFFIRTAFYGVVIVVEGKEYREALRRSDALVRGREFPMFLYLLKLTLLLFGPAIAVFLYASFTPLPPLVLLVLDTVEAFLTTIATVLYLLALTALYGEFTKKSNV